MAKTNPCPADSCREYPWLSLKTAEQCSELAASRPGPTASRVSSAGATKFLRCTWGELSFHGRHCSAWVWDSWCRPEVSRFHSVKWCCGRSARSTACYLAVEFLGSAVLSSLKLGSLGQARPSLCCRRLGVLVTAECRKSIWARSWTMSECSQSQPD